VNDPRAGGGAGAARGIASVPAWVLAAGAGLGAGLGTIAPGLALLLRSFDRRAPDLQALLPELLLAVIMSAFGAVQLRAQIVASGRWAGALFGLAFVLLVGVIAIGFDFDLTAGSVDTGPAFLIGLVIVLAVVVGNALIVVLTWLLIAALAKRLAGDLARPDGAVTGRVRAATWLLVVASAHVVVKGALGGPVLFGVGAALVACVLLLPVRAASSSALPLLGGALAVALVGLGATGFYRFQHENRELAKKIARCTYQEAPFRPGSGETPPETDVLALAARQVPGVADAVSDLAFGEGGFAVTVFVLPRDNGPLDAPLRASVQHALDGVKCTETEDGSRPSISVKRATLVPLVVTAHVVLAADGDAALPGAAPAAGDEARIRVLVTKAVNDSFAVGGPHDQNPSAPLIRSRERPPIVDPRVVDPAVAKVDCRIGDASFLARVVALEPGAVPNVDRVDLDIVRSALPPP
jgi:hypothetical protein